jgi:LuxR family maltose regulon positive regulatory protein
VIALGRLGRTRHPLIVGALLTLGEIAYQRNDLDRVEPLLRQAIDLTQQAGALVRAQQCWAYQQLAHLRQARGDPEGAEQAIEQADAVAREVNNTFYLLVMASRPEWRNLTPGQNPAIVLRERVFMPTLFYAPAEFKSLAQACQLIARRRAEDALLILDRILASAQRDGRGLCAIEVRVWRALALQSLGQGEPALNALAQAIAHAAPERCIRPFLDVGPAVGGLLQQATLRGMGGSFARTLYEAFAAQTPDGQRPPESTRPQPPVARGSALIEPLSERELQVLRLIADGLSNKEIGDQLYIGVGTVKWYATNIYGKLGVSSRTQAVARAHELGLLS